MKQRALRLVVGMLTLSVLLTSCQASPGLQPTAIPPTAVPPTEPPAPTATPALVEVPASSIIDLVGIWWFPQAPGIVTEFKPDGTYRSWLSVEPSGIEAEGNYTVEAGKLTWVTSHPKCNDVPATYAAYVARQDGKPVQLRLQLVGSDPCTDRALALKAGIAKFQNR